MKIAFVDYILWDYCIETPLCSPLGGTQSALCYLAKNLATLGHEVFLINHVKSPKISEGIICWPLDSIAQKAWSKFDVIILASSAGKGLEIRQGMNDYGNLLLWNQHSYDQEHIQDLADKKEKDSYDFFAFVSHWQGKQFQEKFKLNPEKIFILRNCMGEPFKEKINEEKNKVSVLNKKQELIIAYTSTPFRGLNLMIDIFPRVKAKHPELIFKVFSSMKVYQHSDSEDALMFGHLYKRLLEINGVQVIGSVPQADLADELKKVSILVYPNVYSETSCIAVIEALASGCLVITSDLGALPETSSGYAELVPMPDKIKNYVDNYGIINEQNIDENIINEMNNFIDTFSKKLIDLIDIFKKTESNILEDRIKDQVEYFKNNYTWNKRAEELSQKLYHLKFEKLLVKEGYLDAHNVIEEAINKFPGCKDFYLYSALFYVLLDQDDMALATIMTMPIIFDEQNCKYVLRWLKSKVLYLKNNAKENELIEKIENFIASLEEEELESTQNE